MSREKYPKDAGFADGVTVHHRDELDRIQLELREHRGVSVMVYDQTCASEKRRRRKKNTAEKTHFPDPARRVVINELVCEGCGDCNLQVELPVGRAARDRVRPQAQDQSVELQQGLLVPEGVLPELCHASKAGS